MNKFEKRTSSKNEQVRKTNKFKKRTGSKNEQVRLKKDSGGDAWRGNTRTHIEHDG